ncbi:hypothetical protein TSOC_006921, partial [Tetrabaena socialis]
MRCAERDARSHHCCAPATARNSQWRDMEESRHANAHLAGMAIVFTLQLAAVVYIWMPIGYSIDQRKTVLTETVGEPAWVGCAGWDALDLAAAGLTGW